MNLAVTAKIVHYFALSAELKNTFLFAKRIIFQ